MDKEGKELAKWRAVGRVNTMSILMDINVSKWFDVGVKVFKDRHKCNSRERLAAKIIHRYWKLLIEKAIEEAAILEIYGTSARLMVGEDTKLKQEFWWGLQPEMRMRRIVRPCMWMNFYRKGRWRRRKVLMPWPLYSRMFDRAIKEKAYEDQGLFIKETR